jgi:hypothetical protein
MSVDQLELTVREFAGDQSIGVTDFLKKPVQRFGLSLRVSAPIPGIGEQAFCRYPAQLSYPISNSKRTDRAIGIRLGHGCNLRTLCCF